MQHPQNLLVVITRRKPHQPALERALLFAKNHSIKITLFSAIYDPAIELVKVLSPEERKALKEQALAKRDAYLQELCENYAQPNIEFNTKVWWHIKTANAIVDYANEREFDFVIKRISSDADSSNPFSTPIDWHLLRFCKPPLLLVKDQQWYAEKPVLGAVSPTSEDPEHRELNGKIVEFTQYLAELIGTQSHLVNSHIKPSFEAPDDFPRLNIQELANHISELHQTKMKALLQEHPLSIDQVHIVEGIPEEQIPQTVIETDAQLVIMGTVGRTGLTAAFMGNTAERVLARLKSEVLALKPDNFEV